MMFTCCGEFPTYWEDFISDDFKIKISINANHDVDSIEFFENKSVNVNITDKILTMEKAIDIIKSITDCEDIYIKQVN